MAAHVANAALLSFPLGLTISRAQVHRARMKRRVYHAGAVGGSQLLQRPRTGNQVGTPVAIRPPCVNTSVEGDEESFVQVKKNIDDENAEVADKSAGGDRESFIQVQKNIDDDNAETAVVARLEAQSDKDMGEDLMQKTKAGNQVGTPLAVRLPVMVMRSPVFKRRRIYKI